MTRRTIVGLFVGVALIQLAMPAAMIVSREWTLRYGRQYRFRTAPVDPYDPFRGRYVALSLEADTVPLPQGVEVVPGQHVYVLLAENTAGFAYPTALTLTRPNGDHYIQAPIASLGHDVARLNWPFDRYYLGEHLAPAAEHAYRRHRRRDSNGAYVTVRVNDGLAVLEELYIGGMPVKAFLKQEKAREAP